MDIYYFCDIDMDAIVDYLTKERGIWKCQPNMNFPLSFNQAIMFPISKMWMQFLCTRITPTLNVSDVNAFWVILLYSIL